MEKQKLKINKKKSELINMSINCMKKREILMKRNVKKMIILGVEI